MLDLPHNYTFLNERLAALRHWNVTAATSGGDASGKRPRGGPGTGQHPGGHLTHHALPVQREKRVLENILGMLPLLPPPMPP
jgi:hypothetical protein